MANLFKLTYQDKVNLKAVVDRQTQATAEDFNDIKSIVNAVVDAVNGMKCDEVQLSQGENIVTFNTPYNDGEEFVIIQIQVTDPNGFQVAYEVKNKTKNGFTITISEETATLVYLTMPKR